MTIHWGSSALLPDFSPASLFAAGEQGLWYDPDDLATLYQDDAGTTPVTAAGQGVGRILDRSGRNNFATQSIAANEPTYQVSPDRLTIDKSNDRLIVTVPVGGFVGTMVLSTPEGTAGYGVNIPAGSFDIGGVGGLYFPGTAITGQLIRDGAMTDAEIAQTISYMRARGGGLNYGTVTNFTNYWRNQTRITSFPLVDTSKGTIFEGTWSGCTALTSFPLLDVSSGTKFTAAWSGCTSLTSFQFLNVANGTNFAQTWDGCNGLTSFPALNMSNATSIVLAWRSCSGLTSFPSINFPNVTDFSSAWIFCTGITSFPLVDVSSGTIFSNTWRQMTGLTSFPLLDVSSGTNFSGAWRDCNNLISFPLLDVSNGTNFSFSWYGCSDLTSFPSLDFGNGTNFQETWRNCTSLVTFPANMFDTVTATNFTNAFLSTNLSQTSIDNILVSINTAGTSNGTFNQSGGTAPSVGTGQPAIDALRARGWAVTVTGGY